MIPLQKYYRLYKEETNMNYRELFKWANNPISKLASIQPKFDSPNVRFERRKLLKYATKYKIPKPINYSTAQLRNLVLLRVPKKEWDMFLINQSKKAISYLRRAKKINSKNFVTKELTYNDVALRNWGFKK